MNQNDCASVFIVSGLTVLADIINTMIRRSRHSRSDITFFRLTLARHTADNNKWQKTINKQYWKYMTMTKFLSFTIKAGTLKHQIDWLLSQIIAVLCACAIASAKTMKIQHANRVHANFFLHFDMQTTQFLFSIHFVSYESKLCTIEVSWTSVWFGQITSTYVQHCMHVCIPLHPFRLPSNSAHCAQYLPFISFLHSCRWLSTRCAKSIEIKKKIPVFVVNGRVSLGRWQND